MLFAVMTIAFNASASIFNVTSNVLFIQRADTASLTPHTITLHHVKEVEWVSGKDLNKFGLLSLSDYVDAIRKLSNQSMYARIVDSTSPSDGPLQDPLYGITGITLSNPHLIADDTLQYNIRCNAGRTCKTESLKDVTVFAQADAISLTPNQRPYLSIITSDADSMSMWVNW